MELRLKFLLSSCIGRWDHQEELVAFISDACRYVGEKSVVKCRLVRDNGK